MNNAQELNNKVIILYLVDRLPGWSEQDLMSVALNTLLMDYFAFTQTFNALLEQGILFCGEQKYDRRQVLGGQKLQRYYLSEAGERILEELREDIPLAIRRAIDQAAMEETPGVERSDRVTYRLRPDGNGSYTLELCLTDGLHELMALRLNIPDRELAEKMCQHWSQDFSAIYMDLLHLLSPSKPEADS